jgi:hypothetical protein
MDRQNLVLNLFLGVAVLVVSLPLFWLAGGIGWLDTKVFPPRRPKAMPQNAVWIAGPPLPISWHHGAWFGCTVAPSGKANYCRLVLANGKEVYAGEYLPCESKVPLAISTKELAPPPPNVGMWILDKRLARLAPVGALKSGDLILPVDVLDRCDKFKQSGQ